jgi:HTH-type transcriptional regulator/antitoxin HigA
MNSVLENAMRHWSMVAPAIDIPKNEEDYETLKSNIQYAIELVETTSHTHLSSLIESMVIAAEKYEHKHIEILGTKGLDSLKYLVKLNNVRQSDLKEIGSQGVVSEVLNAKRSLTLRHVKELAIRFNVSPSVFI